MSAGDENRDFNQMNIGDMEALVRRDRNHPSVIMWSACNEVECFVTGAANVTGKQMREATKHGYCLRRLSIVRSNPGEVQEQHPLVHAVGD